MDTPAHTEADDRRTAGEGCMLEMVDIICQACQLLRISGITPVNDLPPVVLPRPCMNLESQSIGATLQTCFLQGTRSSGSLHNPHIILSLAPSIPLHSSNHGLPRELFPLRLPCRMVFARVPFAITSHHISKPSELPLQSYSRVHLQVVMRPQQSSVTVVFKC